MSAPAGAIRDTYSDYVTDKAGKVAYFEPGVLASLDTESVEENLKLWAEFSDRMAAFDDHFYPAEAKVEKSLVLVKPDVQVSQHSAGRGDRSLRTPGSPIIG